MWDRRWCGRAALCCLFLSGASLPSAAPAQTDQAARATADRTILTRLRAWGRETFALPAYVELESGLRSAAMRLGEEHVVRMDRLWPIWIAEERAHAGDRDIPTAAIAQALHARALNEVAIWWVESGGSEHDAAWLQAARAPMSCRLMSPIPFARRMEMVHAAPSEARSTLLAGERKLLERWGTKRHGLPGRPSSALLDAADRAIAQLRAGLPIQAEPMNALLAGALFRLDRKAGKPERWEQCSKAQWWLASQLAIPEVDRPEALLVYRYMTMPDVADLVPPELLTRRPSGQASDYPPLAAYFGVEGQTTVLAELDDRAKLVSARVQSRDITVPGVRENRPVAFESLLDAAALDYAARRRYPSSAPSRVEFEIAWRLQENR